MFNVNRQVLRFSVGHICREHQVISTSLVVNRFKDILCANSIYAKEVVSSITGHLGMVLISSKIDNNVIRRNGYSRQLLLITNISLSILATLCNSFIKGWV